MSECERISAHAHMQGAASVLNRVKVPVKFYLQFKNRCVDGLRSMTFEAADDGVEDFLSDGHLLGVVVPRPLTETHICCVSVGL